MRALFGLLITGAIALTAGVIGYQAGLTSSAAAAGATVVVTGGFPGFGTLFFFLFIGVLFFSFAGRQRAGWGPGWAPGRGRGWGPRGSHGPWAGGMNPGDPADPRRQWVADMHRRLHEEDAAMGAAPNGNAAG